MRNSIAEYISFYITDGVKESITKNKTEERFSGLGGRTWGRMGPSLWKYRL